MKLFGERKMCSIVADEAANFEVQRFADNHCIRNSIVDVKVINKLFVVSFYANRSNNSIFRQLQNDYEQDFNVRIGENHIFVTTK
jgi:hypothetical protein